MRLVPAAAVVKVSEQCWFANKQVISLSGNEVEPLHPLRHSPLLRQILLNVESMAVQTATATQAKKSAFFNLPSQRLAGAEDKRYFGESQTHTVCTNWRTYQDQLLTSSNLLDLFANRIPVIRHKGLLTDDERSKMLEVVKSHTLVCNSPRVRESSLTKMQGEYDTEFTWPRVGTSGITQYDHISGTFASAGRGEFCLLTVSNH